jgi:tRNA dimethylallyltransferase
MNHQRPPAIFLMGPTASGKTALAVVLAQRWPLSIVSVDSALVYRGMDVGTAKPDRETLRIAPHRLIDLCAPTQAYSAADFCRDALQAMRDITQAGRVPLLVGGTGMYFRSLQQGMSDLPEADPALRLRLEADAQQVGWAAMHERLRAADPVAAGRIHPNDPQRIQRALEVIAISGRPLSELQGRRNRQLPFRVLKIAVSPADRAVLHRRIEARFATMLESGLIDEVRALMAMPGMHADLPSMRSVGYRQAWQHLQGEFDARELRDRGVFATRQLAKRQITWLRAELDAFWRDPGVPSEYDDVLSLISGFCGFDPL